MEFQTPYKLFPFEGEINSGEILVETAGYVSAQQRIESIMLAGQRLVESRREMYDYDTEDDLDEDRYPVTRDPGFDLADATQITLDLQRKLRDSEELQTDPPDPDGSDSIDPDGSDSIKKEPSE